MTQTKLRRLKKARGKWCPRRLSNTLVLMLGLLAGLFGPNMRHLVCARSMFEDALLLVSVQTCPHKLEHDTHTHTQKNRHMRDIQLAMRGLFSRLRCSCCHPCWNPAPPSWVCLVGKLLRSFRPTSPFRVLWVPTPSETPCRPLWSPFLSKTTSAKISRARTPRVSPLSHGQWPLRASPASVPSRGVNASSCAFRRTFLTAP